MSHKNPWPRLAIDVWSLGLDASAVMIMRTMKIAAGGSAATAEAQRMVNEKVEAAIALQALALTGGLGWSAPAVATTTIAHYGIKVRANRNRLSRK